MKSVSSIARGILALVAAGWLAACQNPVTAGEHLTPEGFVILDGTEVVVQGTGGRTQPVVTGQLTVRAGEQRALVLRFTDRDGTLMTPAGYHAAVQVTGLPGIAQWQPATVVENLPPWSYGALQGNAPGMTTLRFSWMHGAVGSGHEETGWNVTVVVTP
jgi:hypothetical protein